MDEPGALKLQQSQGRGEELDPDEGKPVNQKWRGMVERNERYDSFLASATEENLLVYGANEGESLVLFAGEERSRMERC